MNDIIKICKKHGELTKKFVHFGKPKKPHHKPHTVCRYCSNAASLKSYYKFKKKKSLYLQNYNKNHPEKNQERKLKKKHGITLLQYNTFLLKQNNVCAICFQSESAYDPRLQSIKKLAVDHCHQNNIIRGLLCSRCNMAIGLLNDSIIILKSAIKYLSKQT
jgi:hypothetical protein